MGTFGTDCTVTLTFGAGSLHLSAVTSLDVATTSAPHAGSAVKFLDSIRPNSERHYTSAIKYILCNYIK
jgi:hypothetical protein